MKPTILSRKASNWVDRGEPPNPTLRRVLEFFFERHGPDDAPWLEEQVPVNQPTPDSFSHWIASRLLTPEELARFEAEVADLGSPIPHDEDRRE